MHPGEQLRLIITGHNRYGAPMPMGGNPDIDNRGHHIIIHSGGHYDSHLTLPIQNRTD